MPAPLGIGPPVVVPPPPVVVPPPLPRYFHVIEAALGTAPPNDPAATVGPPGAVQTGGWTRLSTVAGNPVKSYSSTRTSSNRSTGQAEPGQAQIGLLGDNGWLDPTNTASPYYPYLVPGVPIRCRVTDGGIHSTTSAVLGSSRNNFTGSTGLRFTVGANPLAVTRLGRWVYPGNTNTHVVSIVRCSDSAVMASVTVVTAGATPGAFTYAALGSAVTLAAATDYWMVSSETAGGDSFGDIDTIYTLNPAVTWVNGTYVNAGVYTDFNTGANHGYGPVDLVSDRYWPEWRGFVSRWPMSQGSKPNQTAVIDCYDALGWLGQATPLYPTELQRAILAAGPSSYWPHSDLQGSPAIRDVVGGYDATLIGAAALGGPALTVEGVGGSVSFTNQPDAFVYAAQTAVPRPPFTITLAIRIVAFANPGPNYFWVTGAGGAAAININAQVAQVSDNVANQRLTNLATPGNRLAPGGPYVITISYGLNGALTAWVNGAMTTRVAGAFFNLATYNPYVYWAAAIGATAPGDTGNGAEISHVAFFPRVLADAEIVGIASAALTSRAGETTTQRVGYLLDRVGWPAGLRTIGAGTMTVGPVRFAAGKSALDLIKEAVQFEDGMLFADAVGNICVQGRGGTPASSFAIGGASAPKEAPVYSTVDTTVVTSAAVSDPPVIYTAGSSLVQGRVADMKQLANTVDDAFLVAQRAVQLGSSPRPGIDAVTLDPVDAGAALTLDLGAVGAVTRRPIWSGVDIVDTQQVISVTGTGGGGQLLKRSFGMLAPKLKQWHLHCTNANPTGATTPHLARYNPAAVITIEALFRAANWATNQTGIIVAHTNGTNAGYNFYFQTTAAGISSLHFDWYDNTGTVHDLVSTPFTRTGTRYLWANVTFTPSTGVAVFSISTTNRSSYVTWGTATFGATTIAALTTPLTVGVQGNGYPLTGDVLAAYVNAPAATPVAAFDPTGDNQPGASSWTSSTGETWALQGSGLLVAS